MRRLHVLSWLGLALFSVVVFSTATRPTLHSQGLPGVVSINEVTRRFAGIGP